MSKRNQRVSRFGRFVFKIYFCLIKREGLRKREKKTKGQIKSLGTKYLGGKMHALS